MIVWVPPQIKRHHLAAATGTLARPVLVARGQWPVANAGGRDLDHRQT